MMQAQIIEQLTKLAAQHAHNQKRARHEATINAQHGRTRLQARQDKIARRESQRASDLRFRIDALKEMV